MSLQPENAPYRPGLVRDANGLYYRIGGFIEVPGSGGGTGGVTAHGALTGLNADDHPQYLMPSEVLGGSGVSIDRDTQPGSVIISALGGGGGGTGGGTNLGNKFINVQDYTKGATDSTDGLRAAYQAGGIGATFFYPSQPGGYNVSASLKPFERTRHIGQMNPRYFWADLSYLPGYGTSLSAIIANSNFTGPATINNSYNTPNGTGSNAVSSGVVFENLGVFGNGTDGVIDGFDLGPVSGPERAWTIKECMIAYASTGIAGYQWVLRVKDCMISRNGWGIAPHRGADGNSRANDALFKDNYIFFNNHHAIELGGFVESGLVIIANNRLERSGSKTSSPTFDPNVNIDPYACGIYITRATGVTVIGNTTDSNSGAALDCSAVADGAVNNIAVSGNIFKRDGTGDNSNTMLAAVKFKGCDSVDAVGNIITYGDPNDSGSGRIAPQYGVEIDSCNFLEWHGVVQLTNTSATKSNGYVYKATTRPNFQITVTDPRQPQTGILAVSDANLPTGPTEGATYWSTTQKALRSWDSSAGVWVNAGTSGVGGGTASDVVLLTKAEYNAITVKDSDQLYGVTSPGLRETFIGTTKVGEYATPFVGFKNTFEGVPTGTAVTAANSGGTSGTAFSGVSGSVICQATADLTTPYTRGAIATVSGTLGSYVYWDHADYQTNGNIVMYVRRTALPTNTQYVFRALNGTVILWEIRWQANGIFLMTNGIAGGGNWIASVAGASALNTIYRIEANVNGSNGTMQVYLGDSLTTVGTTVDEIANPDPGPWTTSRYGLMYNSAQTDSLQFAYVGISSSDKFGPAV